MSVLDTIFEVKRQEVAAAKLAVSPAEMADRATAADPPMGFRAALAAAPRRPALIAEVKKASPSKGLIRPNLDPAEVAASYARAGAHALSVLTDSRFFQGRPENLPAAKAASGLPALRKDFLFDPYQVAEARAWSADAVLLIAAALSKDQLAELREATVAFGMDALVEVHSAEDVDKALDVGSDLVGINNRDLKDFRTDLAITETLAPLLSGRAFLVAESALECRADVDRVARAGVGAVLIGTAFCQAPDVAAKVGEVMGW
jgi:indole-3-glycerol phosphate synthase